MTSVLGIKPEDIIPGPPQEIGTPEQQLAELRDWAAKMSNALMDFLNLLDGDSTAGFGAGQADQIIQELNDNGTITIDGDTLNIHGGGIVLNDLFDASGDLESSAYTTAITNTSITINANGTLSGAGGGQANLGSLPGSITWDSGGSVQNDIKVPLHFVDSLPTSGSGLLMTSEALGFYTVGTLIIDNESSGTGTPEPGEIVIQAGSGAEGIYSFETPGGHHSIFNTVGTFNNSGLITGQTSGATITPSTVSTSYAAFQALITNQGNFYFAGDKGNYIAWNGTNIEIRCEGGLVGSSTSYMDITNGIIQIGNSTDYFRTDSQGEILVRTTDAGAAVFEAYSTNSGTSALMVMKKSHHATSNATTVDGETFGGMNFFGVGTGNTVVAGAQFSVGQDGPAGLAYVPTVVTLNVSNEGLIDTQYRWEKNGDFRAPGAVKVGGDTSGTSSFNTLTGVTDTPTSAYNWDGTGTAPNGYIKMYVGTQAVVVPYWNT